MHITTPSLPHTSFLLPRLFSHFLAQSGALDRRRGLTSVMMAAEREMLTSGALPLTPAQEDR